MMPAIRTNSAMPPTTPPAIAAVLDFEVIGVDAITVNLYVYPPHP